MSVIMTLRANGDPKKLEEQAARDPGAMRAIADEAVKAGLIAHRFYGSDDGQIMVVDEWPDRESFQRFFEANRSKIEPMMAESGITGEPQMSFWRKLESHDEVGWDS
jgi:heme-degrading monooxygenase HmoA